MSLKALDAVIKLVDADDEYRTDTIDMKVIMARVEAIAALADARDKLVALHDAIGADVEQRKIPIQVCRCEDVDNSKCPIHLVGHPYSEGCCDEEEDAHRNRTVAEAARDFPMLYEELVKVSDWWLRVEVVRSSHGNSVTITRQFVEDDRAGMCFDLTQRELAALLPLLQKAIFA